MSESYSHWGMFPAADTYDLGEVVALMSGGPAMTVTAVGYGRVVASWFDGDHLCHAQFPADCIYSISDDDDEDTIGPCAGSC